MFASEIWFSSPADLVGLIVTAVGIWLVVRQLNEARLASQMEGLLTLENMLSKVESKVRPLGKILRSEEWDTYTAEEAHAYMVQHDEMLEMAQSLANVYETIGNLVKTKALDINLAKEQFAPDIHRLYRKLEKLILLERTNSGAPEISANFEWIANEFEKMSD